MVCSLFKLAESLIVCRTYIVTLSVSIKISRNLTDITHSKCYDENNNWDEADQVPFFSLGHDQSYFILYYSILISLLERTILANH